MVCFDNKCERLVDIMKSEIWLKVLLGLLITMMLGGFTLLDSNKVEKEVFTQHEKYQKEQMEQINTTLKDGFREVKDLIKGNH